MNVTATLKASLEINETITTGLASSIATGSDTRSLDYANGTSATSDAIDLHWEPTTITLAASASATYTLSSLTDALGRTVDLSGGVRYLVVRVTSRTAGDYLTVGAAATNPWTGFLGGTTPTLKVYSLLVLGVDLTDEYAVSSGSSEQLKITNSGSNSISFKIYLGGCSA